MKRLPSRRRRSSLALCGLLFALPACQDMGDNPMKSLVDKFVPPSPREVAQDAFNVYDADTRRKSITLLSQAKFGGEAPYLRLYRLLVDDPDATVRAACVKALGAHGTVDDAKLIIPRLKDDTAFVRWEAAKSLQRIHNPAAAQPLIDALRTDEDADVRMAAAYALGQYPERPVFDVLLGALDDQEFAVVEAAAASLETLTGQKLGSDGARWLAWKEQNKDLFKQQRRYVYHPFVKPRSLVDKAQFWKKTPKVEPKAPTGLEPQARAE